MSEGRAGRGPSAIVDAGLDTLTQAQNQTNRRLTSLENEVRRGRARRITAPTPGSPFVISQKRHKKGIITAVRILLPPASDIDWVKMIYRKTAEDASENREQEWRDIKENEVTAQQIERILKEKLDEGEEYGLVALIAKGDFPASRKSRNPDPPDDDNFLTTWTASNFFENFPFPPSLGSIIENSLDTVTKAFDAFVVIQILAPPQTITALTGTASITTNSQTVTGLGTQFLSQVQVGHAVTVAGETHIVTAVNSNTQLTVDFPFKQTAANQAISGSVLHTWESAIARKVIAKFRLTDDPNARPVKKDYEFSSDEVNQTSIIFRVDGFTAARKYDFRRIVIVGPLGDRRDTAANGITFIAGGFTEATAGIPELTGVGFDYITLEEYDGKQRHVTLRATQPSPPVALDRVEYRKFLRQAGTVSIQTDSPIITGSGTSFLSVLAVDDQVVIGVQTFTVLSIQSNTQFTATANSTVTASGQNWNRSRSVVIERNARRKKHHPETGGQIKFQWGDVKTKKLLNHIFRATIFAQNGQSRIVDDSFTTGDGEDLPQDTAAPVLPDAPILRFKRGTLFQKMPIGNATNVNNIIRVEANITDNTNSLDLDDPDSDTPATGIVWYDIGKVQTAINFKRPLEDLKRIFGPTASIFGRFRVHNNINFTQSSNSNSISLATGKDITSLTGKDNLVRNGHFGHANTADTNQARHWQDYDPRTGAFGVLDQIGRLRWDKADHRAKWQNTTEDNTRFLVLNFGPSFFIRENFYSLLWIVYSNGAPTISEFFLMLATVFAHATTVSISGGLTVSGSGFVSANIKAGDVVGIGGSVNEWRTVVTRDSDTQLTIDRSLGASASGQTLNVLARQSTKLTQTNLALSTTEKLQRTTIQYNSDGDVSNNVYLVFGLRDVVDTSTFPFLDQIQMNHGREASAYQERTESFEKGAGGNEGFDNPPTGGTGGVGEDPGQGGDVGELL